MSYKTAACVLCEKPHKVTAEQQQWLIHIAKHREDLIKFIVDRFSSCVLCAYSTPFADKKSAASHLRWYHSKKSLIEWFYKNTLLKQGNVHNIS